MQFVKVSVASFSVAKLWGGGGGELYSQRRVPNKSNKGVKFFLIPKKSQITKATTLTRGGVLR